MKLIVKPPSFLARARLVTSLGFGVHDVFELHYFEDQLIQMDVLFARPQFLTSRVLSHPQLSEI